MRTITYPFQESDRIIIAQVLFRDGIMIFPTETFYAIGCLATSTEAVKKIYTLKQRQPDSPLLVLINNWEMLERYAAGLNRSIRQTLLQYWPGALTAVLRSKDGLTSALNPTGDTVGFRMTPSPVASELIGIVGLPLVGTSANLSKGENIAEINRTREIFGESIDLYIDGGNTRGGLPSTVVDMTREEGFCILRQGELEFKPDQA